MIKNIIFDIGNVLAAFCWAQYIEELGYTGETARRLAEATTIGPYWCETDRGVMSVNDIIESMISLAPDLEKEIRHFFEDRRRLVLEYDYSAGWMKEMKSRGYKVFILSNYSEDHYQFISKNFSFFGIEDGKVISYQEKVIKPDAAIYNILMNRYGLKAEECVFLDDSAANIEGAKAVGMKGIVFENYEQGRAELEALLAQEGLH